jgi:phosphoribosyl 1,2-cyclic phosphodiesterase
VLRLRSLGSGSTGNATVIEARGLRTRRVLIDCGMSLRVLSQRLARAGLEPGQIDAIFITHEHADHIGCAQRLSSQWGIAVWMSEGTWRASKLRWQPHLLRLAHSAQPIDLGELYLMPFAVPHDAAQPLQLRCSDGQHDWGVLTDLGHINDTVRQALAGCHGLLLECNHDPELLQQIAKATGGKYYDSYNEEKFREDIADLKRTAFSATVERPEVDVFAWPLLAALLLLLVERALVFTVFRSIT